MLAYNEYKSGNEPLIQETTARLQFITLRRTYKIA